jgi:hypothetical protein
MTSLFRMTAQEAIQRAKTLKPYQIFDTREDRAIIAGLLEALPAPEEAETNTAPQVSSHKDTDEPDGSGKPAVAVPAEQREPLLRAQVEAARAIINRGVELMTAEQVGAWEGVRAWLEQDASDYAAPPADARGAEILEECRKWLLEAAEDVECWSGYASEYFRSKHGATKDAETYRERAAKVAAAMKEPK